MDGTAETTNRPGAGLRPLAWTYLVSVYAVATVAALSPMPVEVGRHELEIFVVLGALAAAGQLFVVHFTARNTSYHVTGGVVIAVAILLPPPLVALVVVLMHLPEWVKERYPWFIQTFNIANYTLGAIAGSVVFDVIAGSAAGNASEPVFFAAGAAATLVFIAITHSLLAFVLMMARGQRFLETGLFTFHSLSIDTGLAVLGVVVAALWELNPFLIAPAIAPLLLLHRTLALPKLEAEARQDAKTGLYNARFFSDALDEAVERQTRGGVPFALLLCDLDLLREINNRYGHLAGDAVLVGVARVFRDSLRPHDIAARFGGEEFCVLLHGVQLHEARVTAERIRQGVQQALFAVDTATSPISATISIGIACAPQDASTARDILHLADVAAYRAKSEGRNRCVAATDIVGVAARPEIGPEPSPLTGRPPGRELPAPVDESGDEMGIGNVPHSLNVPRHRFEVRPPAPNNLALRPAVRSLAYVLGVAGITAGILASFVPLSADYVALGLLIAVVVAGQALSVGVLDHGSLSVSAVGSLAGAALIGPAAALPLAIAVCAVEWAMKRTPLHKVVFNFGALTLSSIAAAAVFGWLPVDHWLYVLGGAVAGSAYYVASVGLLSTVIALETREPWRQVLVGRFGWLFVYYVVYGVIGAMVAVGYDAAGPLGLLVFVLPVALVRKAQLDYIAHTEASVRELRGAAETIERQNVSLTRANALMRERATEAMESLAAAVDARDTYTAGHSRRVQVIAVAIAHELGLDEDAVQAVSYGALFHDIGKLAVPDAVLLKHGSLDAAEWELIYRHPVEGERIIGHLGFLVDSTPAIRHHHEWFDGTGYPDGRSGEDIPLPARIVHVADAVDSMTSSRTYRSAVGVTEALDELRTGAGTQFCPACVAAFERAFAARLLDVVLGLEVAA